MIVLVVVALVVPDPAAGPLDRQRGAEDQRRARRRRCTTPRRWARCAPRSSTPRSSSAGCSAAAPGWEVRRCTPWPCPRPTQHPVAGRDHPRLRRSWSPWRPLLSLLIYLVKVIDRRVVQVQDTLQGRGGEHRGHRPDPAGRRRRGGGPGRGPPAPPVPRPRAREGEVMTALVVLTRHRHRAAGRRAGVLPVLGRVAAGPDRHQPGGVRADSCRTIVGHAKLIGPGRGAHQRRPAAWWRARCRCCTGWPRRS